VRQDRTDGDDGGVDPIRSKNRPRYFDERNPATSTGVARYTSGTIRLRSSIFGRSLMAM